MLVETKFYRVPRAISTVPISGVSGTGPAILVVAFQRKPRVAFIPGDITPGGLTFGDHWQLLDLVGPPGGVKLQVKNASGGWEDVFEYRASA